ncbi:hypothetical protein [Mucilaginibacter sp. UYCu711]|uniref:hypothetical protein n=1 Tax=Mucilaginibacter sp. UYCu711 TaxID=3156339 RepID=UPI003D1BD583
MRAVEFETEVINNTITIPENFQVELALSKDKHVRVIVMVDELGEEAQFKNELNEQFLKGYDEADSVYDNL